MYEPKKSQKCFKIFKLPLPKWCSRFKLHWTFATNSFLDDNQKYWGTGLKHTLCENCIILKMTFETKHIAHRQIDNFLNNVGTETIQEQNKKIYCCRAWKILYAAKPLNFQHRNCSLRYKNVLQHFDDNELEDEFLEFFTREYKSLENYEYRSIRG